MTQNANGFTLIELLITMAIIGILATVLIPNLMQARIKAESVAIRSYIRHCITAVESTRAFPDLRIPASLSDCQDPQLPRPSVMERPPYIASEQITVNPDRDTYTIKVVSQRGRISEYDGYTIHER